jgi:cytochrome b subunit of formate dehydrogenase/mono/diheme cytochrome c family protein
MSEQKTYQRFVPAQRIEHAVLIASFTILAITGLVQKYAGSGISEGLIALMGGIQITRIIHRIAATVFLLEAVYHIVVVGYKLFVQRVRPSMLPGIKDATDALDSFKYNLGLSKKAPKMPRYNFAEKAEYWAMIWGLVLMGLTGLMLWNPIMTANILPGQFIPAAKIAHGMEALLAVLAIIIWHFYNVHLKTFNKSMFTGQISHHEMVEDHAAELEDIQTGKAAPVVVSQQDLARRRKVYIPIATVATILMLAGLYWVLTAEKTAIETIVPPQSDVPVFVPVTETPALPRGTAAPTAEEGAQPAPAGGATTWDGGIGALFQSKCGSCHGASALGGLAVDTYANLVKGGATGPGLVPGDATSSEVVVIQQAGDHPGMFAEEELQQVITWINAGAPEN